MSNDPLPPILGRWECTHLLRGFGTETVYHGRDIFNGQIVTLKAAACGALRHESSVLLHLAPAPLAMPGIPKILQYGNHNGQDCLVSTALGRSMAELQNRCGGALGEITALNVGRQVVDRLEFLYLKGLVHCDVRPDNMYIGEKFYESKLIYLSDFGKAQSYHPSIAGSRPQSSSLLGDVTFASARDHARLSPTPKDDLESLVYSMVYMATGELPWAIRGRLLPASEQVVKTNKKIFSTAEVCRGMSQGFQEILAYVRGLEAGEVPDYRAIRILFSDALDKTNYHGHEYAWECLPEYRTLDCQKRLESCRGVHVVS